MCLDKAALPFDLIKELETDRLGGKAVIFRVALPNSSTPSMRLTEEDAVAYLDDEPFLAQAEKLYVVGDWEFAFDKGEGSHFPEVAQTEHSTVTPQEKEWNHGLANIISVVKAMKELKEVTWISSLAFTEAVWAVLPTSLTKLVINLGHPVRLDGSDSNREIYMSANGMRPLIKYTKLKELRLYAMQGSFQPTIWETLYRNQSEGHLMRIVELKMASEPLIRQKGWLKAADVDGLHVAIDEAHPYKGMDGKGTLHHSYGWGEYLDDLAIKRARLRAGMPEHEELPVLNLKLDGFVVDYLPFYDGLRGIGFLQCGDSCVDAGLRAPKTDVPCKMWNELAKGKDTHCMIYWSSWFGVFDHNGHQRGYEGEIIEQKPLTTLDNPMENASKGNSLTTENLEKVGLKDSGETIEEGLENAPDDVASVLPTPAICRSTELHRGLSTLSFVSTRGSSPVQSPSSVSLATEPITEEGDFFSGDSSLVNPPVIDDENRDSSISMPNDGYEDDESDEDEARGRSRFRTAVLGSTVVSNSSDISSNMPTFGDSPVPTLSGFSSVSTPIADDDVVIPAENVGNNQSGSKTEMVHEQRDLK